MRLFALDFQATVAKLGLMGGRPVKQSPDQKAVFASAAEERPAPRLEPKGLYRRIPLQPQMMIDRVTRTEDFFTLVHLGVPHLSAEDWRLAVEGLVLKPLSLTLADIAAMPQRSVTAVHQCAGNPLEPTVPTRRVANVAWKGVPLASFLEAVRALPQARYLWSCGADYGEFAGFSCESYAKDAPLDRLIAAGAILATHLNGEPLQRENGYPVRLVVPGWYGTNSVKWLSRMTLAEQRLDAVFTTQFYQDRTPNGEVRPVWDIPVDSILVAPGPNAGLEPGKPFDIWGWAWAARGVNRVEISLNGGENWMPAQVEPASGPAWQRFSLTVPTAGPGPTVRLIARAQSADGHWQPMTGARNAVHVVDITLAQGAAISKEGSKP
ncbi:MAG: molybdenum-binding oxidoreductase [Methylobacterium sp.]|nr:MAG: molybdenum-binding oxidoreductase [Methylobacterium sp.]